MAKRTDSEAIIYTLREILKTLKSIKESIAEGEQAKYGKDRDDVKEIEIANNREG